MKQRMLYIKSALCYGTIIAEGWSATAQSIGGNTQNPLKEKLPMRTLFSIAVLISASMPAFAGPSLNVPEPESLALIAVAAVAMLVARRRK